MLESRYEKLLEQYAALLRAVISRHCPSRLGIDITDVEQEARIRVWRTLAREKELTDPPSYILRIAVTAAIDAVRRVLARREEPIPGPDCGESETARELPGMISDPNAGPEAAAARSELMMKIRTALSTLPVNRRRAVQLHLQGLTLGEIAHLTGWTAGKARNLVYRGLADLRETLRREGIDYQ